MTKHFASLVRIQPSIEEAPKNPTRWENIWAKKTAHTTVFTWFLCN